MFGIVNKISSTPKLIISSLNYNELIKELNNEIKLSNQTNLSVKRLSEKVRGIDLQKGSEIIYIAEGAKVEEILSELEMEDGSDAKLLVTDSYYNNKLPKDESLSACFGDIIKVVSEDKSETRLYVLMEDDSKKSLCTQIKTKNHNSVIKEIDNLNRIIKILEPVEGLMATDLVEMIASEDGSNQIYDVQGLEPIFDDALITKDNNLDLITEKEEFIVISENRHNVARYKIEFIV